MDPKTDPRHREDRFLKYQEKRNKRDWRIPLVWYLIFAAFASLIFFYIWLAIRWLT